MHDTPYLWPVITKLIAWSKMLSHLKTVAIGINAEKLQKTYIYINNIKSTNSDDQEECRFKTICLWNK